MLALRGPTAASAALLLLACSADVRGTDAAAKPPLDTGEAQLDAAAPEDTGMSAMDTGPAVDTGVRRDAMAASDSGAGLGPDCSALEMCCANAGPLQQRCNDTVAMGNEGTCSMVLAQARGFGQCLDGVDAGPPRDAGPLGPRCREYLACCPTLGALQMICENSANRGDEGTCDQALNFAQRNGRCLSPDSGAADSGAEPDARMDAGTSTISDAGTSTIADGG